MGNSPRRGPGFVQAASKGSSGTEPGADAPALPIGEYVGLVKVDRGWVVCRIEVQGDKVIDKEILSSEPENRGFAARRGQVEYVKTFMRPDAGVSG